MFGSKKGTFLVLDGNDGSGKATQTRLLAERLAAEGVGVEHMDFPAYDRNLFGALLGECLAGRHGDFVGLDPKLASLPYAADRFESSPKIREALAEGRVVIADRFVSSNQIHQGGKIADPVERAAFLAWLDQMEHGVFGIPRPDRIIYLSVPVEVSLRLLGEKRAKKNQHLAEGEKDQVEEDIAYLNRSRESAAALAASEGTWTLIDCMKDGVLRPPEDIHEEVYLVVSRELQGHTG